MSTRVVLCCGSGGVGKTTMSAALAVKWAMDGARVAVLTIDPARRLADSLGLEHLGNEPSPVALPDGAKGSLEAAMLDARTTFDAVVRTMSPTEDIAEGVLGNRYYQFAATGLTGAHEYMAQEKLLQLYQSDKYDIVVLDTPPTRQALDFLRAPDRMANLMDEGVLRWLMMPATKGGWRAIELGSEAVARVLRRLLGEGTVQEIGEFFEVFKHLSESFRTRSLRVRELLRDPGTRFVLVTTPSASAQAETRVFLEMLQERKMPFGGFVVNRAVRPPEHTLTPEAIPVAGPDGDAVRRTLLRAVDLRRKRAAQQADNLARLERDTDAPHWLVADRTKAVGDLDALIALGPELPNNLW